MYVTVYVIGKRKELYQIHVWIEMVEFIQQT